MGELRSHRTKIIRGKRIQIQVDDLQKGMIVECRYSTQNEKGEPGKGKSKKYMLLILNKGYKGKSKYKKVHALTLDNFSPGTLNQLAEKIGLVYIPKYQKMVALDVPKLVMEEASQRFYNNRLRKDIGTKYGASYRTMYTSKFRGITLVNYSFDKKVLAKYFPPEDLEE